MIKKGLHDNEMIDRVAEGYSNAVEKQLTDLFLRHTTSSLTSDAGDENMTIESIKAAIEGLNLQRIAGRAVTVNEARPRADRGGGGRRR